MKRKFGLSSLPGRITQFISNPLLLFVAVSGVFGAAFCFINPPFWGLDEPAHFARAYQIADGQIRPVASRENFGGSVPDNFAAISTYRNIDILDGKGGELYGILFRKDISKNDGYDTILSERFSDKLVNFPVTSTYSPVAYPGPIVAAKTAQVLDLTIGQTMVFARVLSLISYIAICALAIWTLREKKIVWLFVMMALLPTSIFQAAIISSDTMIFALLLLFFALYTRLVIERNASGSNRWLMWLLLAVAILMPLLKINFIFLSLTVIVLPAVLFRSRRHEWAFKSIGVLISSVLAFVWMRMQGATNAPVHTQRGDAQVVSPPEQIQHVLQQPLDFVGACVKSIIIYGDKLFNEMFFTVSGNDIRLPIFLVVFVVAALVITTYYAREELVAIKRYIIYFTVAALVTAVSICGALYVGFTPVGWWYVQGLQGRYFTSLLPPVLMLMAVYLPKGHVPKSQSIQVLVAGCVVVCLLAAITYDVIAFY